MRLSKNVQYAVAGVIALYIVFMTRPAPPMVVRILASPIAQIAALAAVVYIGAMQSLMIALLLAVAIVLSMPAREYQTNPTMGDKVASSDKVSAEDKDYYKSKCASGKDKPARCKEIEAMLDAPKAPEAPATSAVPTTPRATPAASAAAPPIASVAASEGKKESFANARDETLDGHPF